MSRAVEFKTSVASTLSGLDVSAKKLQELVGREKPHGQHHMRYTPADLRAARYRFAGVDPDQANTLLPPESGRNIPPLVICRMTKGGVGKTSCSVNIGVSLAMMGYRVLIIDADPQATASNLLGIESSFDADICHIGHFLSKKAINEPDTDLPAAIISIYDGGFLDLIPSDITLAETDASMVTVMSSHERAVRFLVRNRDFLLQRYDVILVDTAPGTTPIGLAFSYAAKESGKILTIVEPEGGCLRALESLASNLAEIKAVTGVSIGMEVVINKYHPSLKHVRENMGFLYSKYGSMLNDSIIPQFSGFSRQMNPSTRVCCPLVESEPGSVGATAIIDVAKSLIRSFGITHPGLEIQLTEAT